jgi:competence protein ComEC
MLDVLSPSLPFLSDTGDDVNENSIVTMLRFAAFRELFMGDAGEAAEARLLVSGDDLRTDVVKVAHHGSAYASTPEFAVRVHPAFAVISVGRHNTFGRPATTTLDTWRRTASSILRTDTCGAITIAIEKRPRTIVKCEAP